MRNPKSEIRNPKSRCGFTLMELLIVITIIAILAGLVVSGLVGATEQARAARTRAQINKIDALIMEKYEGYRTRSVRVPNNSNARLAAQNRLSALRELMRLELPDQISDLCTVAEYTDLTAETPNKLDAFTSLSDVQRASLAIVPSLTCSYKRLAHRNSVAQGKAWTAAHQGAECLYLILSAMKDGDKSALDFFSPDEIGDVDEDGMKEILDAFGRPIEFMRWAPGYVNEQPGADFKWGNANADDNGNMVTDEFAEFLSAGSDDFFWSMTTQSRNSDLAPDPFDPLRVDPRWAHADPASRPYAVRPLIFSAGPDRSYDISAGAPAATSTTPANDPYLFSATPQPGTPTDTDNDGILSSDNITNHFDEGS